MSFDVEILQFSKIYDQESFYLRDKSSHFIDLTDISGTNCMCDDEALREIADRIGNYHYMSAVYLRKVREPFSLVVLDHHTDMQRPMFDILSCGGWVLDVLENNEFVRDIHVIGADRKLIEELEEDVRDRVKFYDVSDEQCRDDAALPDAGELAEEDQGNDSGEHDIEHVKEDLYIK